MNVGDRVRIADWPHEEGNPMIGREGVVLYVKSQRDYEYPIGVWLDGDEKPENFMDSVCFTESELEVIEVDPSIYEEDF